MPKVIRAIYEQGVFKPTDAVNLEEGTTVQLVIWDEKEPLQLAMLEGQGGRCFLFVPEQGEGHEEIERQVREWQSVYEGLSEEDIAEVERIALESHRRPSAHEGESL
ncbi:MAG: hypothetical protein PVTTEEND_001698 [Candidatus Fervidibacter sp.]|jgi:Protein of unknown function DUF104.